MKGYLSAWRHCTLGNNVDAMDISSDIQDVALNEDIGKSFT